MSDQNPYRERFAGETVSTGSSGPRPEVEVDPDAPDQDQHSTGAGSTGGLPRPGLGRELPDDELASTVAGAGAAPVDVGTIDGPDTTDRAPGLDDGVADSLGADDALGSGDGAAAR